MRTLSIALLLLVLSHPASVNAAPKKSDDCTDCETYKQGVNRKVIQTNDVVCIYFIQPGKDNVMLRLDLQSGEQRRYHAKDAGTSGRICVGRHWVLKSKTMMMCNGTAHADYPPEHVAIVAKKEKHSREGEACLSGTVKCKELGYQTK